MEVLIKMMKVINKEFPKDSLRVTFKQNIPLSVNNYPVFNLYPEDSVVYYQNLKK